jgi:hypothetical protein
MRFATCRIVLATAAALATTLLAAGPAEARKAPACSSKGSKTIIASESARVFRKKKATGVRVYGCLFRANKKFQLGSFSECFDDDQVGDLRLAGRYVGYDTTSCGLVVGKSVVIVRNLATGSVTHVAVAARLVSPGEIDTSVSDLVLRRSGSVAWIGSADDTDNAAPRTYQVRRFTGSQVLLDSGTAIAPGSLAASAGGIYWTKGGQPFSSPWG